MRGAEAPASNTTNHEHSRLNLPSLRDEYMRTNDTGPAPPAKYSRRITDCRLTQTRATHTMRETSTSNSQFRRQAPEQTGKPREQVVCVVGVRQPQLRRPPAGGPIAQSPTSPTQPPGSSQLRLVSQRKSQKASTRRRDTNSTDALAHRVDGSKHHARLGWGCRVASSEPERKKVPPRLRAAERNIENMAIR
jgi:hypothetical protein